MVTVFERKRGLSRREVLRRGGALGASALLVISGSAVINPEQAWGLETKALKPETMATLIQMARDIYPHDQVPDKYYAIAVKSHDEKAAEDPAHKELIEKGVADLNASAGNGGYTGIGWEDDRVNAAYPDRRHALLPGDPWRACRRPLQPEGNLADLRL